MREDSEGGPRPQVYARLAAEAEVKNAKHRPPRATRLMGWLVVLGIAIAIAIAVLEVSPW